MWDLDAVVENNMYMLVLSMCKDDLNTNLSLLL